MQQPTQCRAIDRRISHLVGIAALVVGGLSSSIVVISAASAASSPKAKSLEISTVKNDLLGTILVSGKTLYTLNKTTKVACAAACIKIWPEVLLPKGVTKATAGAGVTAAKLGTVARAGGLLQVTYAGKPLYWFSMDKAAGQVKGNVTDTWGTWSDVVTVKPAKSSSSSTVRTQTTPSTSPSPGTAPTTGTSPSPTTSPTTTTTSPGSGGVAF